jgi:hypothetical protein
MAEWIHKWHPLRVQYEVLAGQNPLTKAIETTADKVRENRKSASSDNPFLALQDTVSKNIVGALDRWRDAQEALSERMFLSIYGSPALQAAVGIDPQADPSPKPEMSQDYRKRLDARIAEIKSRIPTGGLRECVIRGLLYVGASRGMVDERSIEALRRARAERSGPRLTLAEFKAVVREQFFMLLLDQEATLAAIPKLLPRDTEARRAGLAVIREVLSASAELSGETTKRLRRVVELFGVSEGDTSQASTGPFDPQAKAS